MADKSTANIYKALKEDFYSGHSGGTISEINKVTAVAAVFDVANLAPKQSIH